MIKKITSLLFPSKVKQVTSTAPINQLLNNNFNENPYIQKLANLYEGKLLLREEIHLVESVFQKLRMKNYFTSIPSILRKNLNICCQRCNNQEMHLFASINCEICNNQHLYCRSCIQMGRVMECEFLYYWTGPRYQWDVVLNPCVWDGTLVDSQINAANHIKETVKVGGRILVWAVTGSGKTEMLFPGITSALQNGKRVCIATPRADVVRELFPRLQKAFLPVTTQALYGGSRDKDGTAQLIISTTHQLLRYQHAFDVLIIDEIDAFPYHQDETLQFAAHRAGKGNHAMIYLTATPRPNHQLQIQRKTLDHVFVPIRYHTKALIVPTFIYCGKLANKFKKGILPDAFLTWLKTRKHPKRQLVLFFPTIHLTEHLHLIITQTLIHLQLIKQATEITVVHAKDEQRPEKIQQFRKRHIYALLTTTILERGVTFPSIDVAVFQADHVVFDEAALVQIAGRVGRSVKDPTGDLMFFHEGKTDAMVNARASIIKMNERRKVYLNK